MTREGVFDLRGSLPTGTTVLEASAGTGKTYTIAALAARYVAEGVARIDELMLVTFGRAATVELRERVRERLVDSVAGLADPEAARASSDEVLAHLADAPDADVEVRRRRLATAVADFDAATIATTHGFCHQMLAGLGIAADVDADVTFAEATGDLVTDVATDLWVADYGRVDSPAPPIDFRVATMVAAEAVGDGAARLEPVDAADDTVPGVRRSLGERARTAVAERKRAMRVMDYDDLLTHLRDALVDPEIGADARARVRSRYRIVLVDEFQDTDQVQWEILERAFHGHRTLVLIGDPKQAIYAFRGADVVTYLLATEAADVTATLGTNWRSDGPLVATLGEVMGDVALGDRRIRVHPVSAAHPGSRLAGAPVDAPLRVRMVPREAIGGDDDKVPTVGQARPYVARDVAEDVVRLLASGAHVVSGGERRPVEAGDVAVIVQRNEDGRTVRDALIAVDVPVVVLATASVFLSPAARQWLALLTALEQPHRPALVREVALADFVGWSAEDLATADDDTVDRLATRLREWAAVFADRGVAALLETIVATCGLTERVLGRDDGERELTDLRHVGQALHAAATEAHDGVASLTGWLQHRIADATEEASEELSRRLESDAKAVQVLTVHRSKGLEYPIVYAPFLWDRYVPRTPDPLKMHDATGARVIDVGGEGGPGYDERRATNQDEDAGESLRLAYVALTRARSQVVCWWAPTSNTKAAPLHRMLFGARGSDGALPASAPVPTDAKAREHLAALAARCDGGLSVERAGLADGTAPLAPPCAASADLAVREFDRVLDRAWARTSYTGLTAGLHEHPLSGHGQVASEPEVAGIVDEPEGAAPVVDASADGDWPASPMAGLPSGAAFGTLVHAVLETVDFAADDPRAELFDAAVAEGSDRFTGVPPTDLADALLPSLHTPLGPLADGRRLADVPTTDRLDELEYELPLAGGDTPTGEATVGEVAALLRRHLPVDDPLAAYADDLATPTLASRRMRGFLTGSIDLVLRVRDGEAPRYLVVDYKTNWLGASDEALTAWHYRPDALARAMRDAHYPLQALLYSVALHRFLRWRQPAYDPATHLGGVLYLFLRGMAGPDTPVVDGVPCGVFSWRPPAALVVDLSDLLDRGSR